MIPVNTAAVAIIQARMGSTRLPRKVLMNISGKPMLSRVVERARRARLLNDVVVATTINASDDSIAQLCELNGWTLFRGPEDDVLDRYFRAAQIHKADPIVRITSDCPLVDPDVVDMVIKVFLDDKLDYVSNNFPRSSFPIGLDVEVVRFSALEKAWKEDLNPQWREHVTLYIRRHPELFRLNGIVCEEDYSAMRWTVDTQDDLEFVRTVYSHFNDDRFSWREVLSALQMHPQWLDTNRHVRQKEEPI